MSSSEDYDSDYEIYRESQRTLEIVNGIRAVTEKSHYNPETDTNWCHLPMEMRLECIKEMSVLTRMCMRVTSKTEKLLAESAKKCRLKLLDVDLRDNKFYVSFVSHDKDLDDDEKLGKATVNDYQNVMQTFANILKYCEIDTFAFMIKKKNEAKLEPFCAVLPRDAPFRFKTFKSSSFNAQIIQFFLKNCECVEKVFLDQFCEKDNVTVLTDELIELLTVINAKLFQFAELRNMNCPIFDLVKNWIDNDAEIGKKLRFGFYPSYEPIELFVSIFENRVISKDEDRVRIRTNNDSKHIYMRCDKMYYEAAYFSCTIIPSDLPGLPNCKDYKWAKKVFGTRFG